MNIMFFIKPKSELAYVHDSHSVRQAMEIMEHHQYSSIPILSKSGKYKGTLTEGDLLWWLKANGVSTLKETESVNIMSVRRRQDYRAVKARSDMKDLVTRAMEQNYVPVVDDQESFIGMITRKDIIRYCYEHLADS